MNEQFLTIPEPPWSRADWRWTMDGHRAVVRHLREKIRQLSTWAPTVDCKEDAGSRDLAVTMLVSAATLGFAKDRWAIARSIGEHVHRDIRRHLEDRGMSRWPNKETTDPSEG